MHRDGASQGGEGSPSLRLQDGREDNSSCDLLPATGVCSRSELLPDHDLLSASCLVLLSGTELLLINTELLLINTDLLLTGTDVLRSGSKLLSLTVGLQARRPHHKKLNHPGSCERAWVFCCAVRNRLSSCPVRRMTGQFLRDELTP